MTKKPEYLCLGCGHKFQLDKAPVTGTPCTKCGHLYVKWLNWKEFVR